MSGVRVLTPLTHIYLGVGSKDYRVLAEPPSPEGLLAQKGMPSCLGPWTPYRFGRAPADEYS